MGYFCICALLFAIFIELRGCRSELEKIPTRIVAVNVSIQALMENVEATNRRLDYLVDRAYAGEQNLTSEIQELFQKHNT